MTLRLNGSNSGFTEVKAPATAGSNTITLPANNGSANQYLRNGSTAGTLEFGSLPDTVTRATPVALSGSTSTTFTGISSSCKRIQIIIHEISSDSTDQPRIRLGHAGSGGTIVNTGYDGSMFFVGGSSTGESAMPSSGFAILTSGFTGASNTSDSIIELCNVSGNIWVYRVVTALTNSAYSVGGAGHVDVGATVDRVQILLSGSGSFDDGDVTILTED
tara:strand:+ start:20206 stop:20859 length:654 start_codon:yes stop_codon:yes gene_type:complete